MHKTHSYKRRSALMKDSGISPRFLTRFHTRYCPLTNVEGPREPLFSQEAKICFFVVACCKQGAKCAAFWGL